MRLLIIVSLLATALTGTGAPFIVSTACAEYQPASIMIKERRPARSQNKYARIVRKKFTRLRQGLGAWKGYVQGNGNIHVKLQILKNDEIISSHSIGNVSMRHSEKPVSFYFKRPLPDTKGWRWRIVTSAM